MRVLMRPEQADPVGSAAPADGDKPVQTQSRDYLAGVTKMKYEFVILSRFASGRVRHWAVKLSGKVLFKSDHKASVVGVYKLLTGQA